MMSVGKVSVGQESYYLSAVAQGAEDYYSEHGEVPGRWVGKGAGEFGLAGEVDEDDFRSVLSGADPSTGVQLRRANGRVCAFDLTLSAPKSVSVLWALGDPDTAAAVIAAHEVAVDAAVRYVERNALRSRRGHNGVDQVDGGGLIAAAFRHRTSRAGDPQLHTHVVVANTTRCEDGVWRALDGRHLYAHARTAGFLYQAELRQALSRSLGLEWEPVAKGVGEVSGVPHEVLREFSRRRIQIETAMAERGDMSIRSARRLAVTTRSRKDHDVDSAVLAADWRQRAGLHGFDSAAVQTLSHPQRASVPTSARMSARRPAQVTDSRLAAVLTEQEATFDRRAVLRVLVEHAPAGARVGDLEAQADLFLASRQVEAVGVALTGVQYSTVELLAIERHLLDQASSRQADGAGVCDATALVRQSPLSVEQAEMVATLTSDGAGVSVVVGAAGTGKTHALAVANEAWQQHGYTVVGCALSARAANELQTSAQIPSFTLDSLLAGFDRSPSRRLKPDTVVVVDEAAMVGTRKLARLMDHAAQAHAKVVLVGDHHQLPAIEAGGAFAVLAQRLGAIHLTNNQRQGDPIERAALSELRAGDPVRAIDLLDYGNRISRHRDRDGAYAAMVKDWLPAALNRQDVIMLAPLRVDVAVLNRRARRTLIELRKVDPLQSGELFAPGDRILTLTNDRRSGLINGERGIVTRVDPRTGDLQVQFDTRKRPTRIPAAYIDAGGLDYGYAMTIHKAQGLTCDRAYVLGDGHLHREAAYTALSRGRHENRLYAVEPEPDHEAHVIDSDFIRDTFRRALDKSEYKSLATEWQPRGRSTDIGMEL